MSEAALQLDDFATQDLRALADRLLEPDAVTAEEERAAIVLIAEVTSPTSPDTVLHDRTTKPVQYAKAGVPLYLLVDQELGTWTLHGLAEGWQRYQIVAVGAYGEDILLPPALGFTLPTADRPRWLRP